MPVSTKELINVVTCGHCGEIFAHSAEHSEDELTCPVCGLEDDISSFPDLWVHPERDDSLIPYVE